MLFVTFFASGAGAAGASAFGSGAGAGAASACWNRSENLPMVLAITIPIYEVRMGTHTLGNRANVP